MGERSDQCPPILLSGRLVQPMRDVWVVVSGSLVAPVVMTPQRSASMRWITDDRPLHRQNSVRARATTAAARAYLQSTRRQKRSRCSGRPCGGARLGCSRRRPVGLRRLSVERCGSMPMASASSATDTHGALKRRAWRCCSFHLPSCAQWPCRVQPCRMRSHRLLMRKFWQSRCTSRGVRTFSPSPAEMNRRLRISARLGSVTLRGASDGSPSLSSRGAAASRHCCLHRKKKTRSTAVA
mmetsp:Transcript_158245/g.303660  ORF Transcript_158245/g.303660 Transcript_158245/m.303660 type:complete len:239 (+) Transcript_158245:43-759(+)